MKFCENNMKSFLSTLPSKHDTYVGIGIVNIRTTVQVKQFDLKSYNDTLYIKVYITS